MCESHNLGHHHSFSSFSTCNQQVKVKAPNTRQRDVFCTLFTTEIISVKSWLTQLRDMRPASNFQQFFFSLCVSCWSGPWKNDIVVYPIDMVVLWVGMSCFFLSGRFASLGIKHWIWFDPTCLFISKILKGFFHCVLSYPLGKLYHTHVSMETE